MTTFVSWNVNGLRACLKKGFEESMKKLDPDFICIQETKMQEGQAVVDLPEYDEYYCYADRKGYSGTAVFAKKKPVSVSYNIPGHTDEGRVVQLEYDDLFVLLNTLRPDLIIDRKTFHEMAEPNGFINAAVAKVRANAPGWNIQAYEQLMLAMNTGWGRKIFQEHPVFQATEVSPGTGSGRSHGYCRHPCRCRCREVRHRLPGRMYSHR